MRKQYDVAIVGGAAMGSAVAYFLGADPDFDGSVLVVERDPTYEKCSTTLSFGGIRQQFSTAENVRMSLFGAEFARNAADRLAADGERPDVGFREQGYLFLASPDGLAVLEENIRIQQGVGAEVLLLEPAEIGRRFPWLNLDGIAGAGYGPKNEGWIDPYALLQAMRRKARAQGADYVADEVTDIEVADGRVAGLTLRDGGRVGCGHLVNAAGWHAGRVAAMAGVELPVGPRKRMAYVFDCREDLSHVPLTIDVTGVAFRPEGSQYIVSVSPPEDRDPETDDFEPDLAPFDELVWPALAHRIPAFEAIKLTRWWVGHYDYNSLDQNGIIGPHPEIGGLYFCNGFSGHGIQQSPAAGRAIAELIVHGGFRAIDLARFGFERIAAGRPLRESYVV